MSANIRFSAIIPACDRGDSVREAVDSVLRQTFPPVEILIVDNGTESLPGTIFPRDERIRIVRGLPRFGVSQARNVGAIVASGSYLAFLDDDDCWDDRYLEEVAGCIENGRADVVLGSLRNMSNCHALKGKSFPTGSMESFRRELLRRNPGAVGSNTVISRAVFMQSSGYDPYLTTGQDKAIILDLIISGVTVERAEHAWVDFRVSTFGERQTEIPKRIKGKKRFIFKYWSHMSWSSRVYNFAQLFRLYIQRIRGIRE